MRKGFSPKVGCLLLPQPPLSSSSSSVLALGRTGSIAGSGFLFPSSSSSSSLRSHRDDIPLKVAAVSSSFFLLPSSLPSNLRFPLVARWGEQSSKCYFLRFPLHFLICYFLSFIIILYINIIYCFLSFSSVIIYYQISKNYSLDLFFFFYLLQKQVISHVIIVLG